MKLALAISSYNGDMAAADLAATAVGEAFADVFSGVAIVDSGDATGCAQLERVVQERAPEVEYLWSQGNLGAAGNLDRRLAWARSHGADALLAVNADGRIDSRHVAPMRRLIDDPRVAAVYPTAILEGDVVDLSYRRSVPVLPSRRRRSDLPAGRAIRVRWGSSNGAMYDLAWIGRIDTGPVVALWHGWEDLALGALITRAGGVQLMAVDAEYPTSSDQRRLAGAGPVVSAKEPWTTYYTVRNLLLLAKGDHVSRFRVIARIGRELLTILTRDRRRFRYAAAIAGFRAGFRGDRGQRPDSDRFEATNAATDR